MSLSPPVAAAPLRVRVIVGGDKGKKWPNRYAVDKSTKFGTRVPWVILKHPRRGAQKNLKQEVSHGQNSKWPTTVLAIDSKDN